MPSAPEVALPADAVRDLWSIEPRQYGVVERIRELWHYRYLWWYFASLSVEGMYRRTKLGWLWLIFRVSAPVGLNSLIFGGLLGVESNGPPYFLFFVCGSATWILFERSLLIVTRSLERNRKLITKVYFPRLILPMSAVAPGLLYLSILLVTMIGADIYFWYHNGIWYIRLRPELLVSAVAVVMAIVFTISVGLWTSVLQARYRDMRQGIRYFMPFWMYFTPVIYPVTTVPEQWRWLLSLNPMAGIVEAFKWGTLGVGQVTVVGLTTSFVMLLVTLFGGIWFFNRAEAASIDKLG